MIQSRFSDSQIMAIVKQEKNGLTFSDVCREYGISMAIGGITPKMKLAMGA